MGEKKDRKWKEIRIEYEGHHKDLESGRYLTINRAELEKIVALEETFEVLNEARRIARKFNAVMS